MKKFPSCDTIKIENSRAICPICGGKLQGEYPPGCSVDGVVLSCKRCHKKIQVHIVATRDQASSVQ